MTKAEVYEHIRFQLLEMKEKAGLVSAAQQETQADNVAALVTALQELDKSPNDQSSHLDNLILFKNDIERLRTKLQVKELENQQLNEQVNELNQVLKERLAEIANRIIDCFEEEDANSIKERLEIIIYRLNHLIQNGAGIKEKEEPFDKYQKEFCELSLSEKEKAVFNYIHQSPAQEGLRDICLDDLLQIPTPPQSVRPRQPSNESPQHRAARELSHKLLRLLNCRSEVIRRANREFESSEESEENAEDDAMSASDYTESEQRQHGRENNTIAEVTEAITTPKSQTSAKLPKNYERVSVKAGPGNDSTITEKMKKQQIDNIKEEDVVSGGSKGLKDSDDEHKKILSVGNNSRVDVQRNYKTYEASSEATIESSIQSKSFQVNVNHEMIKQRIREMKKKQLILLDNPKNWEYNSFIQSPPHKSTKVHQAVEIRGDGGCSANMSTILPPNSVVNGRFTNAHRAQFYPRASKAANCQCKLPRKHPPNNYFPRKNASPPSLAARSHAEHSCESTKRPSTRALQRQMATINAYRAVALSGGTNTRKNSSAKSIARDKSSCSHPRIRPSQPKTNKLTLLLGKKSNQHAGKRSQQARSKGCAKKAKQEIAECSYYSGYASLPLVSSAQKLSLKNDPTNDYGIRTKVEEARRSIVGKLKGSQSSKGSRNFWTKCKSGL